MQKSQSKILLIIAIFVCIATTTFVTINTKQKKTTPQLTEQNNDTLKIIVEQNIISYEQVKDDSIAGLQVLMIERFAKDNNIKNLKYINELNLNDAIKKMLNNEVDILAWHIPIYADARKKIPYTIPVFTSRQILLQRNESLNDSVKFIRNQFDLAKKTIHIAQGTYYKKRIQTLSSEIGDTINISEIPNATPQDLCEKLMNREIDYTVCDEFVARQLVKEFKKLDMSTAISFTQNYSWGVNPKDKPLLDSINNWLKVYLESKDYNTIYRQYTGVD